ncbi:MAG TPA: RluA family pseudouridine synthase [Terriglobales bacterium]|nr:RluA family pseudouridine synthase [Terriglobales bacterium]
MALPEPRVSFPVAPEDAGNRLDQFLTRRLAGVSRARVQELIRQGKVEVNGAAAKSSLKLRGGERVEVLGPAERPPLRAEPEEIPLDVVYEDDSLAVVNKPAGMLVHAGAGTGRGTLVNALLHRFRSLSGAGGELRPGIVHRLDKQTSGLVVVAKDDATHRALAEQFSSRQVKKRYLALVHGWLKRDAGTVEAAIHRDRLRRTRMTTRRRGGREALSRYKVLERMETPAGRFTQVEVEIATGRTHQIRVHMASLGHPVVGDTLYGAPRRLGSVPILDRNFLHAAALEFRHPKTGKVMALAAPLPAELEEFVAGLRAL